MQSFAYFDGLDDAALASATACMREFVLPGGSLLFSEGDVSDAIYFLMSGRCRAFKGGRSVGAIHPGEPIGEIGYFARVPRTATIMAERDCTLCSLSYEALGRLIADFPQIGLSMARVLAERIGDSKSRQDRGRTRTVAFLFGADMNADLRAQCAAQIEALFAARHRSSVVTLARILAQFHITPEALPDAHHIDRWLSDEERSHDFVLYFAGLDDPPEWQAECQRQADRLYILHRHAADARVRPAEAAVLEARRNRHVGLILLQAGAQASTIRGTARWTDERQVQDLFHILPQDHSGWSRIARTLSGDAVGLVLAGGGALYPMHLGVMKALLEAGLRFDHVGGSSAGACAAVGYALGVSPQDFAKIMHGIVGTNRALSRFTVPLYGLVDPAIFDRELMAACDGRDVEDLAVPFFATAVNLSRNRFEILDRGPVWEALRASASIPGLLPPYVRNGDLLSDGAAYDSLPVSAMRERISGPTIAVSFPDSGPPVRYDYASRTTAFQRAMDYARLKPLEGKDATFPHMIDSLMRVFHFSGSSRLAESLRASDLVFEPPTPAGTGMLSWDKHELLFEQGYRYGAEQLEEMAREGDAGLARITAALA